MKTNIVLCGFMGSGKTTLGRALAQELGYGFADMDQAVEEKSGASPCQWIQQGREAELRRWEGLLSAELSERERLVIATGGGVFTREENGRKLSATGRVILLRRRMDLVYPVISADPNRPLAYGKTREELEKLEKARLPLWEKYADLCFWNNGEPEGALRELWLLLDLG